MKKLEAVRISHILADNFKMPVARNGMFESYVTTGSDGKELLYIGAGALGVYVDIETLEVVEKVSRNISSIEEVPTKPRIRLVEKTYNPDDYED